jgi:protein SCO1/2
MGPASAGLSRAQLAAVSATPPAGASLDPALTARDAGGRQRSIGDLLSGRVGFVVFVDYTCTTLCGTDLFLLSQALVQSRVDPRRYRILVVGIDPKDTAQAARAMARSEIPPALWPDTVLLLPDRAPLKAMTRALGFHYVYDADDDQFAHPPVVYAVGADGALRATLTPFALAAADIDGVLRSAPPRPGLWQRVRLLCYAHDPLTGKYTLRIALILRVAGLVTLAVLGVALGFLFWTGRRAT